MGGVGEKLASIDLPPIPAVLVNPRVPVETRRVFAALGLAPVFSPPPDEHAPSTRPRASTATALMTPKRTSSRGRRRPMLLRSAPSSGALRSGYSG
jgi:4-diphosphocytidyl-2C-methyl-D-erythritol kinase